MDESPGYRAAAESVAFFPDLGRRVVEVSGSRALRVIDGLASNAISGVPGGIGVYSFMLDRKGRVLVDMRVLPAAGFEGTGGSRSSAESDAAVGGTNETLWLDVPGVGVDALSEHLTAFVPPIFATYRGLDVRVLSLQGPASTKAVETFARDADLRFERDLEPLGSLGASTIVGSEGPDQTTGLVVKWEAIEGPGVDLLVPATESGSVTSALAAVVASLGGAVGQAEHRETHRIERGIPALGRELGPDRLAQEAGQDDRAISFEKGCFTGQEVVARIRYRGHVNRNLCGLRRPDPGDQELAALEGAPLTRDGRPVGTLTSVTESPRFGTIALGYVRREIEPGATVLAGESSPTEFEVSGLPFTKR